jgi:DNA-binding response OmpR family regulator
MAVHTGCSPLSRPFTMRVLLVEDEHRLARSISAGLGEEGFAVEVAADGLDAEARALEGHHRVLVVDWRLPGQDGPTLVARLRAAGLTTPVLMLTARTEVESRVAGLEAGADDYLGKPFAFEELLARVRALVRRSTGAVPAPLLRAGPLVVDSRRRGATLGGVPLELRPKEFALLEVLAAEPGAVASRADIAEHVWGDPFVSDNALDVTVSGLRTHLADAVGAAGLPRTAVEIETVRGIGYRLASS